MGAKINSVEGDDAIATPRLSFMSSVDNSNYDSLCLSEQTSPWTPQPRFKIGKSDTNELFDSYLLTNPQHRDSFGRG